MNSEERRVQAAFADAAAHITGAPPDPASLRATGRGRSRRTGVRWRWLPACAAGALVAAILGAAWVGTAILARQGHSSVRPAVPGRTTVITPALAPPFCTVPEPATWSRVVADHRLPLVESESLNPIAMSPDGKQVFAADYTPTWSGVVAVSTTSHQRLHILEFAHPDRDQLLGAAFDGRWLIFSVTHDMMGADGTTYTWDSRSGHVRQFPSELSHGAVPMPGAIYRPVADNGYAAWTQGRPDGSAEVHLYAFATGADKVVTTTSAGQALFWRHLLLWPAAPAPDAPAVLQARAVPELGKTPLPRVLAHLRGPQAMAASGSSLAWVDRSGHKLYSWRLADAYPRLVAGRDDSNEVIDNPAIAGRLIMWTTSERTFAADLRSASATTITPYWGLAVGRGPAFFVAYPVSKAKGLHTAQDVSVLPASLLPPLPRCR